MKTIFLTIFVFIQSHTLLSQNQFNFPANTKFYEIPGDNFLALTRINSKIHVSEVNQTGSVIWTDSIGFIVPIDTIDFFDITQFKGTDEFVVYFKKNLSSEVIQGNKVYQFSKFNRSVQAFTQHRIDTIVSMFDLKKLPMNSDSIYFFSERRDNNNLFFYETYTLSSNLDFQLITPADTMFTNFFYVNSRFFSIDNKIYKMGISNDYTEIDVYTDSVKFVSSASWITGQSNYDVYVNMIKEVISDTLLFFSEGKNYSQTESTWYFELHDLQLNSIRSNSFTSPYSLGQLNVKEYDEISSVSYNNRMIYVLTHNDYHPERYIVYVYDLEFSLVCKIQVPFTYENFTLNRWIRNFNDMVYTYVCNNNSSVCTYDLINTCFKVADINSNDLAEISLYPNPVLNVLTVDLSPKHNFTSFTITNLLGINVLSGDFYSKSIQIDVSSLSSGTYFFYLNSDSSESIRFIKE